MKNLLRLYSLIIIVLISSCTKATVQHPGAINSFDNFAYDALITEQAAINQAKTQINQFPQAKTQLNNVIVQYDQTQAAYKVYHLALSSGTNPDSQQLSDSINSLITNVAALIKGMTQK